MCSKLTFLLLSSLIWRAQSSEIVVRSPPDPTSLARLYEDKKLFEYKNENITHRRRDGTAVSAGVTITCAKCYIKGTAKAKLTKNGSFNATEVIEKIGDNLGGTLTAIKRYAGNVSDVIEGNVKNFTWGEIPAELERVPPPQINFNVPVKFPGFDLQFEFNDVELYVQLKTVLSSGLTYSLTLFSSKNMGVQLNRSLFFGVIFSIDLIISTKTEIEISSGFHVRFEESVRLKLALFGEEASDFVMRGAKIEFLPITIEHEGVVMQALLRLQLRTGFSLPGFDAGLHVEIDGKSLQLGAGIEGLVYVDVADFMTNITGPHDRKSNNNKPGDCRLHVAQDYRLAIGAAVGATVNLLGNIYGPTPATEIPIFYTTWPTACLKQGKMETTPTPQKLRLRRGDRTTTTATTTKYTATACLSPGLVNCPASLQSVQVYVVTKTLTAVVPQGSKAMWTTAPVTVVSAVDFQKGALAVTGVSGPPRSYVPPPPTTTSTPAAPESSSSRENADGAVGPLGKNTIIGISVGATMAALTAVLCAVIFFLKKRQRALGEGSPEGVRRADGPKKHPNVAYTSVRPEEE